MVDHEQALRFVAELASAESVDEFTDVSLRGLARVVPADLWGFNDIDAGSRQLVAAIHPPDRARPEDWEAVANAVWEHPVLARFEETGQGPPTRLSDLWSRARYEASALYRTAYRAMGVEYQVAFSLADGPAAATIGFAANRRDRDFDSDELALLALLRPPLRSVWRRLHATGALATAIRRERDRDEDGLLLVDAHSQLECVGDDARLLLGACGLTVGPDQIAPEPIASWLRRAGQERVLQLGSGDAAVALEVIAGARDAERVVAVRKVVPQGVRALTRRELEVARLASAGATDADIARRLAVSRRTVQKHLQRAYSKLGVANRTAAAAALRDADHA